MQHLALGFVELHLVHVGPLLKLVQLPLDSILLSVIPTAPLSLVSSTNFAEGALDATKASVPRQTPGGHQL